MSVRCLVAKVCILFLLISIFVRVCNAADHPTPDQAVLNTELDATTPSIGDQVTNIPYFTLRDGMSSTLTLNNLAPSATTVRVTVFNLQGWAQVLAPIVIGAHSYKQVSLRAVVVGEDFESGNIEVAYTGAPMAVTCQISIFSLEKRISFEAREQERMDFMSSTASGIVWLPQATSKGFLAVTNIAAQEVSIRATAGVREESFILGPHQTRLLELNNYLAKPAPFATLVTLRHNGSAGDIVTTGFVLDDQNGYSSSFSMVDSAIMVSRKLAGVHFRFGQPDPTEGFPHNTYFEAPLLLANVSPRPVNVRVFVDHTIDGGEQGSHHSSKDFGGHVLLKTLTISPAQIAQIELSDELHRLGVSGSVKESGIDIRYDAPPGAVIAQLTSADQTGNYSFEVPIKDPSAMNEQMEGNYPWALGAGNQATVHFKNTTGSTVQVLLVFNFPGGGLYNPAPLILRPFQSASLDIQKLKTSKKKDFYGRVFPAEVMRGQLQWHQVTPYSIVARLEQTNIRRGIAQSFSCGANCCTYYTEGGHVNPSSFSGNVGATTTLVATISGKDCTNNPYVKAATRVTFTSSNTSVATVNSTSGSVNLVGAGQATIFADFSIASYDFNAKEVCVVSYHTVRFNIPITSKPVVSGNNTVWWFQGLSLGVSGYTTQITLTATPASGSSFQWAITSGSDKVVLSGSGAQVQVTGIGKSGTANDVSITVTVAGQTSSPFKLTVLAPYALGVNPSNPTTHYYQDNTYVWRSEIPYQVRDNFLNSLPVDLPVNESWTTAVISDYSGTNWRRGNPGCTTAVNFLDKIAGEVPSQIPTPVYNTGQNGSAVQHWGQDWRVGTCQIGSGPRVQSNVLQKYVDHAAHTNKVSPAP